MSRVWAKLSAWLFPVDRAEASPEPPFRRVAAYGFSSHLGDYADLECGHRVPLNVHRIKEFRCYECLNVPAHPQAEPSTQHGPTKKRSSTS